MTLRKLLPVLDGPPSPDVQIVLDRLAELERAPPMTALDVNDLLKGGLDTIYLDDEVGAICRIHQDASRPLLTIAWLLPEGMSRSRLGPLLGRTILDVGARLGTSARTWRIEARFTRGRDVGGNYDGGLGACTAWKDWFTQVGATAPIVQEEAPGQWVIWWELGAVLTRLRRLGLG